jgi:aminopeptidase N
VWLDSQDAKEAAMRVDARAGTHPIVQPILDVLQANEAFDTITYSKGQAVIRMLENYTGEDAFRAGVRSYIKAHAYGNTVTDDLWREIDKTSPRPVSGIAHDFTLQAGVPLIRASVSPKGVVLTQDRFAMDDTAKTPLTWQVPVLAGAWRGTVARGRNATIPAKAGVVVNDGQASYFRTAYDGALMQALAKNFRALSPENQLGLLNDSRALGYSGYEPLSGFLALASQADPSMNPKVLNTLVGRLEGIDDLSEGLPVQKTYRAFARQLLAPIFAKVGWDAKAGEDQNIALLRASLLGALSQFDDPGVVQEARRRFAAYLRNPAAIAADTRHSMLAIVARHADAAAWDALHGLAGKETNTVAKQELYDRLGAALDRTLAGRALALTLTDEVAVTTRPGIIDAVSANYPDMAFDFTLAHLAVVGSWLEADSRTQYVPRLVSNSNDAKMIGRLNAFAQAHIPATARADTVRSASSIAFNAQVRSKRLPDVERWLASRGAK